MISLSLVSKHFREVTAQRLYEKFQIIFPDDDDSSFDGSIDSLAAGLETFTTSDYNYARFLKNVSMDTVTSGSKGERAYRRYTSDESCGKFMNTLMMLTLRQAKKLDTFHWNIRVELSRPLYQTLHKIETLERLTIRMHPGRSNYEKPPPLQSLEDEQEEMEIVKDKNSAPSITDILFSHNMKSDKAKSKKPKEPVKETPNPPTISGFKNLKTLAVLDMDTLEYIPEIKQAIDNSAKSLTKLKISFSEQLARAARKPPAPVDVTDDSDVEMDDFGNGLAPPPPPPPIASSDDGSGPQKTLAAQEAKKEQEAVLGKIFGIEPTVPKKGKDAKDAKDADGTATPLVDDVDVEETKFEKDGQRFIRNILLISKKLMTSMNPNRTQQQKEALEIIEKAAKKYVEEKKAEEDEKKENAQELAKKDGKSGGSSKGKKFDDSKAVSDKGKEEGDEEGPSLFDDKDEDKKEKTEVADDAANPDDINVEEPEMVVDEKDLEEAIESGDDAPRITWQQLEDLVASYAQEYEAGELAADETSLYLNVLAPALSISPADTTHFQKCVADMEIRKAAYEFQTMVEARKKTESEVELRDTVEETEQLEKLTLEHALRDSTGNELEVAEQMKKVLAASTDMESVKRKIGDYVRSTRGLQLKTLAIYLIPIKASTLSKAIDIRCLNRITLLNVGPQSAFWTHMEKENALLPLPLEKIQTDNVSASFLKFVEKMQKCTELFMLERNTKVEIYSTAPKSGVTIGQIRKALRDKWSGLKRLVIRNESDYSWDANERFIETLCRRGTNLEELGITFSSKGVVSPPSLPSPLSFAILSSLFIRSTLTKPSTTSSKTFMASPPSAPSTSSTSATTTPATGFFARSESLLWILWRIILR